MIVSLSNTNLELKLVGEGITAAGALDDATVDKESVNLEICALK